MIEKKYLILLALQPLVALLLLQSIKRSHRLKIPGLIFGFYLELLLLESLYTLETPIALAWLAVIPAGASFVLGPGNATPLLILPLGIAGHGIYMALTYGSTLGLHHTALPLKKFFIPIPTAEWFSYALLIGVLYLLVYLLHLLVLRLYRQTLKQQATLSRLLRQKEELLETL